MLLTFQVFSGTIRVSKRGTPLANETKQTKGKPKMKKLPAYGSLPAEKAFPLFAKDRFILENSIHFLLEIVTPKYLPMFKAGVENWRAAKIRTWSDPVFGDKKELKRCNKVADAFIAKAVKICQKSAK